MHIRRTHNGRIVEITHNGGRIAMDWKDARELHRWLTVKLYGWQTAIQMHPGAGKQS